MQISILQEILPTQVPLQLPSKAFILGTTAGGTTFRFQIPEMFVHISETDKVEDLKLSTKTKVNSKAPLPVLYNHYNNPSKSQTL